MTKKLVSCILVVCMLLTMLPTMAWAEPVATDSNLTPVATPSDVTLDIADGSIEITATGYKQGDTDLVEWGTNTEHKLTIKGSKTQETPLVLVKGGSPIVTLDNVTMALALDDPNEVWDTAKNKRQPAVAVYKEQSATIILSGDNAVTSWNGAGMQVAKDATVIIKGNGTLTGSVGSALLATYTGGNNNYRAGGNVILESGTLKTALYDGNGGVNFTMTGGTMEGAIKTTQTVSITGGNINDGYTGEITGRKLTKLVFTEEYAGKEVLVSETNDFTTPAKYWSAKVSADGTITTYLDAAAEKVYFKLNGDATASEATISYGVANMGTQCTCGTAGTIEWAGKLEEELTLYKDMASSKNRGISASYKKVETCAAIVHPGYDDVKVTMTVKDAEGNPVADAADYATYANGKLTMKKPADVEKYTVMLTAASTAGTPVTKSVTVTIEDAYAGEFQWTNQLGDVTMFDTDNEIVIPISAKYVVAETVAEGYKTVDFSVTVKDKDGAVLNGGVDSYATYADGTLTLKRQSEVYSVELKAETENGEVSETQIAKVTSSEDKGFDMANGSITVTAGTDENAGRVVFTQGEKTLAVAAADKVTITGSSSTNNIEISTDATIVLKDLSLTDIKAKSPIKLTNNATLNLWLEGENTLTTGNYNHNEGEGGTVVSGVTTAAIFVESGSTLIIDSEVGTLKNDDIDTAHYGDKQTGYKGSLFAKIGASRGGASAIGGDLFASPDMACGNITIKGGNVTAQATMASNKHLSGSAIGSGYAAGDGSVVAIKQSGDVTILGGNVRALVAEGSTTPGRAISSGVGDLTITGGVIYASAPNDGWNGDSAGSIATYTGTLTIGETTGDDSDLYIYAETTTTNVTGTDSAAPAIGVSSGGTLNILSGTITAESTGNGPAIGVAAYAPVTDEPVVLNIAGGTIDLVLVNEAQADTAAAMGIGGGNYDNAVEINISGGTIESNDLNIGVRGNAESSVNISGDAVVKIENGNLVGDVAVSDTADITIGGTVSGTVNVGAGSKVTVTEEIKGEVTVEGGATINGTTLPEDADTVTVPADKLDDVTVDANGTVTLPADSTITKADGSSVELSEGGTMAADGAITAGGTVTTKDAQGNVVSTVVVPEGKDATVSADGTVTAPAGTTIKQEGKDDVVLDNGGTVDKDGAVTETPVTPPAGDDEDKPVTPPADDEGDKPTPQPPYSGGYYPSYTPSVTPAAPSVDSSSLNNAALAVGSAIKDGSAELTPVNGYTKDEVLQLQKDGKLRMGIEKKSGYGSVADKNLAEAAIKSAGGAVNGVDVMYFDITPVLKLDNGTVVAHVTDTEKAITITIELSGELTKAAKDGKDIAVVRVHDGKAEFLSAKLNSAKTKVTFDSADFSTYAVVALNKTTSAQTFDAGIGLYVGMSVLAATGGAVVIGKKRRAK